MSQTRGLRLGRIAGTPVILTAGSAVLAVVLYAVFLPTFRSLLGDGPSLYLITAALPLALLASILVHEVAHGLTARAFKIPVSEYVLTIWGGHTALGPHVDTPARGALVAVAGPAANGLIAGAAWLVLALQGPPALTAILLAVAYVNLLLAVFNVLPGLPMDGGRLLESAVWAATGNRTTGTLTAARAGQGLAVLVGAWGLWTGIAGGDIFRLVWALLIAGVLWAGAQDSVKRARAARAAQGVDLLGMLRPVRTLDVQQTVADWDAAGGPREPTVLVAADRASGSYTVAALVQDEAAARVPAANRDETPLHAVATPIPREAVLTRVSGPDAVAQVARAAQAGATVLVVVHDGGVAGLVTVDQVARAMGA